MPITGTVPITAPIAPTSETAIYPVTNPRYGLGGLRSVETIAARNEITQLRRERGMMVYVEDVNTYYTLIGGTADANWTVFTGSTAESGNFFGSDNPLVSGYPYDPTTWSAAGLSDTGITGDRLLIATGSAEDPFRNYVRFGDAWIQTGVVGIGQGPKGDQGIQGVTGSTGGISFTYGLTAPSGATQGDRWMSSNSGIEYVYIDDGNTPQWVQPTNIGSIGATGARGATGAGGGQLLIIDNVETSIDPILMKGKTASSLSGETISLSYVGGVTPLTGGVYLTNPSQGTGFPVYFPTGAMDSIAFTTQTLTAGIGNSVTLRLVITGGANSASHDIEIFMGNSTRWGVSSLESLTAGNMRTQLTQSIVSSNAVNALPHTIGVTAMYGEYVYYAYPARLGEVKQSINNGAYGGMYLQGNFGIPGEVSVMYSNELEYMESFYITRSRNPYLGSSLEIKTVSI